MLYIQTKQEIILSHMREALAKLFKDLEDNEKQFRKAIWKNTEHDEPVTVTGELRRIDGKRFSC